MYKIGATDSLKNLVTIHNVLQMFSNIKGFLTRVKVDLVRIRFRLGEAYSLGHRLPKYAVRTMRSQDATEDGDLPILNRIVNLRCGVVCCGSIGVLCGSVLRDSAVYSVVLASKLTCKRITQVTRDI
jgi:hypothetical protein